ncbi:hypothetical protein HMI56_005207, partial [Coelomomyces lativittatus]
MDISSSSSSLETSQLKDVDPSSKTPESTSSTLTKRKRSTLKTYYEYNLDKMHDFKGGYLVENLLAPPLAQQSTVVPPIVERKTVHEPPVPLDPTVHPSCQECPSLDLDPVYSQYFLTNICFSCKKKYPEKYSLLTKTEVRE